MALKDAVTAALMAGAQTFTDQPFYSNYLQAQQKRREMELEAQRYAEEQAYKQAVLDENIRSNSLDAMQKKANLRATMAENRSQAAYRSAQSRQMNAMADWMGNMSTMSATPSIDPATGQTTVQPDWRLVGASGRSGPRFEDFGAIRDKERIKAEGAANRDVKVRNAKLGELTKAVDFFESKISEIPSGAGLSGRAKGFATEISAWLQTDPKAAAYKADVDGMRSQIARGLGEVGNLSENEQKYAINLLPKLTDNMETRKQKIQNFKDYIVRKTGGGSADSKPDIAEGTVGKWNGKNVVRKGGKWVLQ